MISPTGKRIRNDEKGFGNYGAPRGGRPHKGVDYLCEPGQEIVAPISGKVERIAYPYADKSYSGIVIAGPHIKVKLFYLKPFVHVGDMVKMKEPIGYAEDISQRYGGLPMLPHIHLEIVSLDPEAFMLLFQTAQKLSLEEDTDT